MQRLVQQIPDLWDLYDDILSLGRGAAALLDHKSHEYAFEASKRVKGEKVLLLSELYVSGGSVQSAASAMTRAGADAVVALVIARLIDQSYNDANRSIWANASAERFCFDRCCLCDTSTGPASQAAQYNAHG
ncbi:hypothetical protein [Nonomuraea sp. NPDC003709]|uniref:hypothetical protein n=1 Tax=Nonomuraea sp. NPDC003709 TaxID=3154450 RepID=UPI0033B1F5AF